MKLISLMDDKSDSSKFKHEHGLSYYIELNDKKILFDTGKTSLFIDNAKTLGVKLEAVEIVVLSHGHYDHSGGLKAFLEINDKAIVYVAKGVFEPRYAIRENGELAYIGIDPSLKGHPQIMEVTGGYEIHKGITLFSGVPSIFSRPKANGNLMAVSKEDASTIEDDFMHEQNLLIEESGHTYLIAGCAHNGICNIIDYVINELSMSPTEVFGGFHLHNRREALRESPEVISRIGDYLIKSGAIFYTGHCTGEIAYNQLKKLMGDKIFYLASGCQLEF